MEQQLEANSIRIKVLERENATLHSSLEKLRERAQHNAARVGWMKICYVVKNMKIFELLNICGCYWDY